MTEDDLRSAAELAASCAYGVARRGCEDIDAAEMLNVLADEPAFLAWAIQQACVITNVAFADWQPPPSRFDPPQRPQWEYKPKPDVAALLEAD